MPASASPQLQCLFFQAAGAATGAWQELEFCCVPGPQPSAEQLQEQRQGDVSKAEVLFSLLIMILDTGSLAYFCTQRNLIRFIIAEFACISITTDGEWSCYYISVPLWKELSISHLQCWQEAFPWQRGSCSLLSLPFVWQTVLYQPGDLASCHCDDTYISGLSLKGKSLCICMCINENGIFSATS